LQHLFKYVQPFENENKFKYNYEDEGKEDSYLKTKCLVKKHTENNTVHTKSNTFKLTESFSKSMNSTLLTLVMVSAIRIYGVSEL
jgi:hypothetical protein